MRRTARAITHKVKAAGRHVLRSLHLSSSSTVAAEPLLQEKTDSATTIPIRATAFGQRYMPIKFLGSGGNGEVNFCRDVKLGTVVAVKTIQHDPSHGPPNEVKALQFLGHDSNIVRYHTMLQDPGQDFYTQLVFEYCELGDLAAYVNANMDVTPEMFVWHVFKHIAAGLDFIHNAGVVHGDLKPVNILLTHTGDGSTFPTPKIADFGAAVANPPSHVPRGHFSTPGWQAPEALVHFGPESDIWALGCIIHELTLRRLPLESFDEPELEQDEWFGTSGLVIPFGTEEPELYKRLCHYMVSHRPAPARIDREPMPYSKLLNYLMMRTLDTDHSTRISASELHRVLLVLEPVVYHLLLTGQEEVLDCFEDGRDDDWNVTGRVTDSMVFGQIFSRVFRQAHCDLDGQLMTLANTLLRIMGPGEQEDATQFAIGLGISEFNMAW